MNKFLMCLILGGLCGCHDSQTSKEPIKSILLMKQKAINVEQERNNLKASLETCQEKNKQAHQKIQQLTQTLQKRNFPHE